MDKFSTTDSDNQPLYQNIKDGIPEAPIMQDFYPEAQIGDSNTVDTENSANNPFDDSVGNYPNENNSFDKEANNQTNDNVQEVIQNEQTSLNEHNIIPDTVQEIKLSNTGQEIKPDSFNATSQDMVVERDRGTSDQVATNDIPLNTQASVAGQNPHDFVDLNKNTVDLSAGKLVGASSTDLPQGNEPSGNALDKPEAVKENKLTEKVDDDIDKQNELSLSQQIDNMDAELRKLYNEADADKNPRIQELEDKLNELLNKKKF
jgi:hypothetical protein